MQSDIAHVYSRSLIVGETIVCYLITIQKAKKPIAFLSSSERSELETTRDIINGDVDMMIRSKYSLADFC